MSFLKFKTFFSCMEPWTKKYSIPSSAYILFLNITDNLDAVNDGVEEMEEISITVVKIKYNQRYYKYAKGTTEINFFASKITPANGVKFTTFLSQDAYELQSQLFKNFKENKDQIGIEGLFEDPEKCFDDIAKTFIKIIEDAKKAYEASPRNIPLKERIAIIPNTTNYESINTKISDGDNSGSIKPVLDNLVGNEVTSINFEPDIYSYIRELENTIKSLIEYGYETYDGQVRCFGSDLTRAAENELAKQFEHFRKLFQKITKYNETHHDDMIDNIISTINRINKENFVAARGSFRIRSISNNNIHILLDLTRSFLSEKDTEE